MIHQSRTVAALVRNLRQHYGPERVAQTNSRRNGRFSVVRIYERPEDKGNPARAAAEARTLADLRALLPA